MTVLRDGTIVDESIDAAHVTWAKDVRYIFGYPRTLEFITIHHWGALGQDFDTVVRYLASDNDRQSSAHAVIMAGRATSIVSPENAAWHAGSAEGNAKSIGLECRPEATDADYVTVAAYIAHLRSIYGDLPLKPHKFWHNTACPGNWDLDRLDKLARSGAGIQPESTVVKEVKEAIAMGKLIIAHDPAGGDGKVWIGDGIHRRHIADEKELKDLRKIAGWKMLDIFKDGETQELPSNILGVEVK